MNPLDAAVGNMIVAMRDSQRPSLELVVSTLKEAFGSIVANIRLTTDGGDGSVPGTWIWEESNSPSMPKFYILSTSTQEGTEGFPLLTIRQAYSVRLDTWVSTSCLVVGTDSNTVLVSVVRQIAQQVGAYGGVRYSTAAIVASGGDPTAGIVAMSKLHETEPDVKISDLFGESKASKDIN